MALAKNESLSEQLADHLASQLVLKEREADFDMEDALEAHVLSPFKELHAALLWLKSNLTEAWRNANREALHSQSRHRLLARIAIAAGTAAIVMAIVQPPVKETLALMIHVFPSLEWVKPIGGRFPTYLEVIAVAAAVVAVAVGLKAKFDRRWLGRRHRAERLRMLKFRSLIQLWRLEPLAWQKWVTQQLAMLDDGDDPKNLEEWLTAEMVEPEVQDSLRSEPSLEFVGALSTYYRFKRVEFQANYFARRREDFTKETGRWLHLSLPLFLGSVACVVVHLVFDAWAAWAKKRGEAGSEMYEMVAAWFLAFAAIFPVLGMGVRAWFAAFELPRSANLFAAKCRALRFLTNRLQEDVGNVMPTLRHIAHAEIFLEQEHREWLRLHRETEWFL